MKKKLLILAAILGIGQSAFATVHMVTVADFVFTPASMTGVVTGDTVMWMWVSGVHTTTSEGIPSTATTWNAQMTSTSTTFMYVPKVAGTYNYECTIHATMGMVGSFTVTGSTGVANVAQGGSLFRVFPNPAAGSVRIVCNNAAPAHLTISDMTGKEVMTRQYGSLKETDLDLGSLPNGNYVVTLEQSAAQDKQEIVVKR